jgi:hypothetical protein
LPPLISASIFPAVGSFDRSIWIDGSHNFERTIALAWEIAPAADCRR